MALGEDQKKTDAECVSEREMLLGAFDTLNGGVIILDADKRIVAANSKAAPLLDIPEKFARPGADFHEFARFAAERGDYGEGDPEETYRRVISVLAHRRPYQLTRRRPDGVILEIHGEPIVGGGYVARFRDVTADKRRAEDLADATRSSHRYKRFFELSQEMMGIADEDGRLHTLNDAWSQYTGWSQKELGAKPFIQFIADEDVAFVQSALQDIVAGKSAADFTVRVNCKGRAPRWFEWHVAPDGDGQLFCVVHDVSDARQRQIELEEARLGAEAAASSKAEFLATMSHEIRTPMNGIIGLANLLLDTDLEIEQRNYAQSILESGDALLAIIDDILDISKIEAGKLKIDIQEFSLADVVGSVADILTPRALEKRLELTTFTDPKIANPIRGDAGKLRQILLNLLGNSIKFTEAGEISIRTTVEHEDTMRQTLRFEVTDTGIGIPDSVRAHLFTPFSQGDASTTSKYGGTGLGLSICRQLTDLMDGDIGFDSAVGEGTTFWFTLPFECDARRDAPNAEAAGRDATPQTPSGGGDGADDASESDETKSAKPDSLRVLLVEDNAVNQMLAMAILKKAGHRVDLATDGVEAVESATNNDYDVILMDIQMPNMDGLEATRRIRAFDDPTKANVHIVAITANALLGDRETCLSAGMNDYLPKPIDQKRLLTALESVKTDAPAETTTAAAENGEQPIIDDETFSRLEESVGRDALANTISVALSSAPANMAMIQAANTDGDLERMYREAHDMGNSFGDLGAARLHTHIVELTTACREGRTARASQLANQMPDILDQTIAAIKARLTAETSRVA